MKIDKSTKELMKKDIEVICSYYLKKEVKELRIGDLFNIWNKVYVNRHYSDSNSNVILIDNVRLLPMDLSIDFYPCDTNDNTLQTGLIQILTELGYTVKI